MLIIKYICLGLVQGLTEFLPVSSSAHLVIFQELLQIEEHQLLLDIMLHLGTLLAVVVFLFKDIRRLVNSRIILYVFLATVLTGLIVVLGQGFFEGMFYAAGSAAIPLAVTGVILLATKKFAASAPNKRKFGQLRISDSVFLGIIQGLAVIPGLSRSGVTISTLLFRNVERETAFKFSFLISIPAILGALFLKITDFSQLSVFEFRYMLFGFLAAFFSGLLALKILQSIIQKARLHLFGYYCLGLALLLWIK